MRLSKLLDKYHNIPSHSNSLLPITENQSKYNCRIKYFPDGTKKAVCFSRHIFNPDKVELHKSKIKTIDRTYIFNPFTCKYQLLLSFPKEKKDNLIVRSDSIKRAVDKVYEISVSNQFKYFITLTLDQQKISRYDTSEIIKKLNVWLSNKVRRNGLQYIILPEYHKKDKAIHFHGLCSGNLSLTETKLTTSSGQPIYNLDNWEYGFSTVIKLDNALGRVARYITKYITKDTQKIFGRFYFSGGNLIRSVPTYYFNADFSSFAGHLYEIPVAKMAVKYFTDFPDLLKEV